MLTQQEIFNLAEGEHYFYAKGTLNGKVLFDLPKEIHVQTRKKPMGKYGNFALLWVVGYPAGFEFAYNCVEPNGRLIEDSGDNVYTLELSPL